MRLSLLQHGSRFVKVYGRRKLSGNIAASNGFKQNVQFSEEVQAAMHYGRPVVALESTIITHGMPYPDNLSTALKVESIIRENGAIPATIGILQGKINVGLEKSQLEFLAEPNTSCIKTSRRDLPFVLSQGLNGGTTVSGTMLISHITGIPIFVTGGIGGVHRGAETSLDISADLTELGRTPVTVISAGIKSILDIGRTLEYLETEGVCVATYGTSHDFPAFFSSKSGYRSPYRLDTPQQAASMIYSRDSLDIQTGSLIAVPIPEQYDTLGQSIENVIQSVVKEAEEKKIQGQEVTPYILKRVNELTAGKSLEANIHLICNNARVGAEIAVALTNLKTTDNVDPPSNTSKHHHNNNDRTQKKNSNTSDKNKVCVVGGSIVDFTARMTVDELQMNGGTYTGSLKQSYGGVGRNVSDALTRLGVNTTFISAIGQDSLAAGFKANCKHMNLEGVACIDGYSTATYCPVLQNGELLFGIGDMNIHQQISPQYISQFEDELKSSSLVCMDGNISVETMEYLCKICLESNVPVLFEPTDLSKAVKPFQTQHRSAVIYTSPNFNELKSMASFFSGKQFPVTDMVDDLDIDTVLHECTQMIDIVSNHIPVTIVTLGCHGVVVCYHGNDLCELPLKGDVVQRTGNVNIVYHPVPKRDNSNKNIVSVSGAGDCLVAAFISSLLMGRDLSTCIHSGLLAGEISLYSSDAVPTILSQELIQTYLRENNFKKELKKIIL
ncbi:hypothetical protein ACF0H5_022811 [Mactra antiquata]